MLTRSRTLALLSLSFALPFLGGINACNSGGTVEPTPLAEQARLFGSLALDVGAAAATSRLDTVLASTTSDTTFYKDAAECFGMTALSQGLPFAAQAVRTNATEVGPLPGSPASKGTVRPCLDKFGIPVDQSSMGAAITDVITAAISETTDAVSKIDPSYAEGCVAKQRWLGVLDFLSQAGTGVSASLLTSETVGEFVWPYVTVTGLDECAKLPPKPKAKPPAAASTDSDQD